ncbi:hypothetical protein [Halodurantibacterium flavum]|uniref:Uncharacterized protein n=1 Tax=Halodurantibacterium flavum TaxID=1382802 RepID=A0ABW4S6Q9_9RHOB
MSSKMPPVPPKNQSDKGPGDSKTAPGDLTPAIDERDRNTEEQGRQGNIKQNTTNKGHQQGR